jgi:ATP-dependent DNA helicase RecG
VRVDERLKELNERQGRALEHLRERGRITNREYVTLFEVSDRTALYDLQDLVNRRLLIPVGSGRGRYYILREDV